MADIKNFSCPGEIDKYMFVAEWFDEKAELKRYYLFSYYTKEAAVEMYDIKNKRSFLKKTPLDLRINDLFVGSCLNIFARQITLVDCGDGYTRQHLSQKLERTFGLLEQGGFHKIGLLFQVLCSNELDITKIRMVNIKGMDLKNFYETEAGTPLFIGSEDPRLASPVLIFEIRGRCASAKWRALLGTDVAKTGCAQDCLVLRECISEDLKGLLHGPSNSAQTTIEQEMNNLFHCISPPHTDCATFQNCTMCIVKPHAIKEGTVGAVIQAILDKGFDITAMEMFTLNKPTADEFYEVYKGVVTEFPFMVEELISGPCIALEISSCTALEKTPLAFRECVGPHDPDLARYVRPGTIRAQFGRDKIKNAVHCSDLPEDGLLEVEYFFKILCSQLP